MQGSRAGRVRRMLRMLLFLPVAAALPLLLDAGAASACCNGDVDGDGDIDTDDRSAAVACSGQPTWPTAACRPADVNCDGDVDSADVGVIDCQIVAGHDLGCCVPTPCDGDFNNDGVVSAIDLQNVVDCNNETPLPPDACYQADVNCDGVVTLDDVAITLCQISSGGIIDPACCASPPVISSDIPGTFCIEGTGNNSSWSWQINGEPVVIVPGPAGTTEKDLRDAYVTSIEANASPDLKLVVVPGPGDSCFQMAPCCDADVDGSGIVDAQDVTFLSSCLSMPAGPLDPCYAADINCDGAVTLADVSVVQCGVAAWPSTVCCGGSGLPLSFKVGDAGGTIGCFVSANPLGCAFNPMIYEEPYLPSNAPALALWPLVGLILSLACAGWVWMGRAARGPVATPPGS